MFDLQSDVVALLAIGSAVVSLVLLGVVALLGLRLRRLRREHQRAFQGDGAQVVTMLGEHGDALGALRRELATLRVGIQGLGDRQQSSLSQIGVVRYDAFDDMGGKLSFSAALLDERGNGLVISAINGRAETRCYSKPVREGRSDHNLSSEETSAVDAAIAGRTSTELPPEGRRRRRAS